MNFLKLIQDALSAYPEIKIDQVVVNVEGEIYDIILDDIVDEEDQTNDPFEWETIPPEKIEDHVTLMDAILHALRHSPLQKQISGVTTDGDHKNCEAIFNYKGQRKIIKIK